ncbi:adenine phosphoribosyltransferase [Macromonas bipunctata]|uniref:adenine phosphoribosyltransferase n=1 Tax=Macromonas bipunctata TaxID=183670 RepID=UPI000C32DF82|nr:adenine phosphoribosyltransferase [Macromonas bipunctata]
MNDLTLDLRAYLRTVPDWPVPGVQFCDITPLLQDAAAFRALIDTLAQRYRTPQHAPQAVAALDARGFVLGAALAYALGVGFVPIRKQGRLPYDTVTQSYELECGSATLELHTDAVRPGQRVLLVDDVIATGGTLLAGKHLLQALGAQVTEAAAILAVPQLGGVQRLQADGLAVFTLL